MVMTKKGFIAIALAAAVAGGAFAQARGLDGAIRHVATEITHGIPAGASVAVTGVTADAYRMSNHLVGELTEALLLAGRFTVVDWAQQREGVQYAVSGDFEPHMDGFRLRARVTRVQGGVIVGVFSSAVLRTDATVVALLGAPQVAAPVQQAAVAVAAPPPTRGGFTSGQRWATYWLNWLVPGLGSFVIMNDWAGGTFQLITGLGGNFMTIAGVWLSGEMMIFGIIFQTAYVVLNIVRSAGFTRAAPALASMAEAWNVAIAPGKNGIERVALTHTLRF